MSNREPLGLFGKYIIQKADGSPTDPKARYFTLRLDTDPYARVAAREYAAAIRRTNPILARELIQVCDELDYAVHLDRRNGNGHNGNGAR